MQMNIIISINTQHTGFYESLGTTCLNNIWELEIISVKMMNEQMILLKNIFQSQTHGTISIK